MYRLIALTVGACLVVAAGITAYVMLLYSQLPNLITVKDYDPVLVSQVYDRAGNKIGEFGREKRTLAPYKDIPKIVVNAFLAAEDSTFFEHSGINYLANLRAFLVNLKAGEKVQGASTITQQVARSILLLSREKTYARKIKEILLSYRMEANLTKEEILYLYLNQIFLGEHSYGITEACNTYFNKELKDITLPEAALLAGIPKAPSELNPVQNPERAKERQRYVLRRLADDKMITAKEAEAAVATPIKIYIRKNFWELAPYYLETVRQVLISKLGEEQLDKGIKVYTSLDLPKQVDAQKQVQQGLRDLDKRQGYRGALENTDDSQKMAEILLDTRNELIDKEYTYKTMGADGKFPENTPLNLTGIDPTTKQPLPVLPAYAAKGEIVKAIVTKVDDEWGLVYVRFAESKGLIDFSTMKWARPPEPTKDARWAQDDLKKPSDALKKGDVILVKIADGAFSSSRINDLLKDEKKKDKKNFKKPETLPDFKEYAGVELEQEPTTEAALLAVDQKTDEIISMVGGYDYNRSKLNRSIQTARQTGSSFKTIVYTAALDKEFTPATPILDAPIVYEEEQDASGVNDDDTNQQTDGDADKTVKKWRPANHSNKFVGDILFRNALIRSLNVPSVKILEKVGVPTAVDYARRMGIFSPLNLDFTLALGSSSITLYEMTKMFAQIGRLGRRAKPILVHKVEDRSGKEILGAVLMDEHFSEQLTPIEEEFEKRRQAVLEYQKLIAAGQKYTFDAKAAKAAAAASPDPTASDAKEATTPARDASKEPPIFFADPDQLIKPQTAYVMTTLLEGVVDEPGGTGAGARSLGRPVAGKTGTTNSYYDAWFLGYTADIAAGVWVGYDHENTLGRGEVGGRAALPIWVEYMKTAHDGVPVKSFSVPEGITFASIDNDSGKLASPSSKAIVKQAFIAGTEPKDAQDEPANDSTQQTQEFYKDDLSQ